jgi:UPF0716 protein FxsA
MALLVLLFIVLPIAELYVIIQVGQEIGVWWTLALLIADSFVGAALARSQGRAAWRAFNLALAEGRVPARETFDGAMIILGGALLLTPGFITDVFGILLLLPPTRAMLRGLVTRLLRGRVAVGWRAAGYGYERYRGRRPTQAPPPRGYDVEGTAREVTDPPPELSGEERG